MGVRHALELLVKFACAQDNFESNVTLRSIGVITLGRGCANSETPLQTCINGRIPQIISATGQSRAGVLCT